MYACVCMVMEAAWMLPVVYCGCPCPAFLGAAPTAAGFVKSVVRSCPTAFCCYANPALLLQPPPDHPLYSIERHHLGGPIPTTTAASTRVRVLRSASPSSAVGDGPALLQERQLDANTAASAAAATKDEEDGADRMFATARALHLRRHRSPASRGLALKLLQETLRRRPAWRETDSRFAVESGIDEVFEAFSCPSDLMARPDGSTTSKSTVGDIEDVRRLRETLARVGYTARTVQERFGVAGGQRLAGPYYLRKSFDHKNVSYVLLQHMWQFRVSALLTVAACACFGVSDSACAVASCKD